MTTNFKYTDALTGRQKEAAVYIADEFVFTSAPNSPVITGPDGKLSSSVIPATLVGEASNIVIRRKLSEAISIGEVVRPSTLGYVAIADPTDTLEISQAIGIALQAGVAEDEIRILVIGTLTHASFADFGNNEILFLDEEGGITDEKPLAPDKKYLVILGKHLGGGEIFVNIQTPTRLGI